MDWARVKQLFYAAAKDRAVLDGVEPELRAEVESLLKAHEEVPEEHAPEGPGTTIGPYKLLQEIGEGGFGVVYMAEQEAPVRRMVALKIIKLGMDTKQVIARFEAERQALALMDHPNIAKVLDAGATEQGRPYFVMELVRGIPITEYCDQARLDTNERLALFTQICHAVQHAHLKGIIHRDLKPGNVLVTLHDGRPVPKVIDFGIAKATDRRLTERTLFTEFRQWIGTPDYMAPEQAELSGLDVDTRADVYSLGVLLYELLTGTKPFDLKTLLAEGYEEIRRTIREVDPPRPSTRLSTMGEQLTAVAKSRHTAPGPLGKAIRGDLDWIVMKALEKDRSRRYETANGLATDVQRFLSDEPVRATPPTASYRLGKYLKRHRVGVTAAAVVLLGLVSGSGLAYAGMHEAQVRRDEARRAEQAAFRRAAEAQDARARESEQRERAEKRAAEAQTEKVRADAVLDLLDEMLSSADPSEVKGRSYTVRQLLDDFDHGLGNRLEDQPGVEASLRATMGRAYLGLGLPGRAEALLRKCLAARERDRAEDWLRYNAMSMLGEALAGQGRYAEAEPLLLEGFEGMQPPRSHALRKGEALARIVGLYEAWGKPDEARDWRARQ